MSERFDLASLRSRLLTRLPSQPEDNIALAGVAVIIDPDDRDGAVLLIRRTERSGDPWSGQIGFPGGHKSPSDQGLLQTAIREAEEEVGIELIQHELLGALPFVMTRSQRVRVAPFVFVLEFPVALRMNREVAESFWVPLTELTRLEPQLREVHVDEGDLAVFSYDYQGRIIWGLTFRILNLLLNRNLDDDL
ncbi:MAG TPA: CoA pyrophosphatase [archaeon]|nr:CoA pyrophosphatase [archaeon]